MLCFICKRLSLWLFAFISNNACSVKKSCCLAYDFASKKPQIRQIWTVFNIFLCCTSVKIPLNRNIFLFNRIFCGVHAKKIMGKERLFVKYWYLFSSRLIILKIGCVRESRNSVSICYWIWENGVIMSFAWFGFW